MKGHRLEIKIATWVVLTLAVSMTVLDLYPSWSQYARTAEEMLLLPSLALMAGLFLTRSHTHPHWFYTAFTWPLSASVGQCDRWAGYMFFGILCTPVTIGIWWVEVLHYLFTVSAIGFAYASFIGYQRRQPGKLLSWVGLSFAIVGMIGGLWFRAWSIGVGELMAAFPVALYILNTNE